MSNIQTWKSAIKDSYTKFELINPARAKTELGFANQLFQSNPMLQKCTAESIINAVVNVARTSVTLNPVMRLAYLIPRGNKCVLEFSYMGMVAMLKDNNCIKNISAKIVYKDEEFNYDMATNLIHHIPIYAESEEKNNERTILGCYSRAVLFTNDVVYEYMAMWEINKIKNNSANSHSEYSAWKSDPLEMIKKSVIKRHFKMLISLGSANNEQVSAFIKVENENDPLKNNFNNQSKQSLKNSFIDEDEIVEETEIIEEENTINNVENLIHKDNKDEYNINDDEELQSFNDLFLND